jgi:hypothetical protein
MSEKDPSYSEVPVRIWHTTDHATGEKGNLVYDPVLGTLAYFGEDGSAEFLEQGHRARLIAELAGMEQQ